METRVIKLADIKPAPYNPRVQLTPKDRSIKPWTRALRKTAWSCPSS